MLTTWWVGRNHSLPNAFAKETNAASRAAAANTASLAPPGARAALLLTLGNVPCSLVIRRRLRCGFQFPLKRRVRLLSEVDVMFDLYWETISFAAGDNSATNSSLKALVAD